MSRIHIHSADACNARAMADAGVACIGALGISDTVIACAGVSVGFDNAEFDDLNLMRTIFETNNIGLAATFQPFTTPMRARGSGAWSGSPASQATEDFLATAHTAQAKRVFLPRAKGSARNSRAPESKWLPSRLATSTPRSPEATPTGCPS